MGQETDLCGISPVNGGCELVEVVLKNVDKVAKQLIEKVILIAELLGEFGAGFFDDGFRVTIP
jgi:hypothetical protein